MGGQVSWTARRVFWFAVVGGLLVVLLGVTGRGPLSFLKKSESEHTTATGRRGVTTSTIDALQGRTYEKGDCVIWDERPDSSARATHVVPCSSSHLIEISGSVDLKGRYGDIYPRQDQWGQIFDHECGASVEALLGGPIDPFGKYAPSAIVPLAEGWSQGERLIWCGAELANTGVRAPSSRLFTGVVKHADQTRLLPVGTCMRNGAAYPVACTVAHDYEIAGYAIVSGSGPLPAEKDDAAWSGLVGDQCRNAMHTYLGREVNDANSGWLYIRPLSWIAGRRSTECTVGRYRGRQTISVVGSLRG